MFARTMQSREAGVEKSHDCISGAHPIRGEPDTGRKEDCRTLGRKERVLVDMCLLRVPVLVGGPLDVAENLGPYKPRTEIFNARR